MTRARTPAPSTRPCVSATGRGTGRGGIGASLTTKQRHRTPCERGHLPPHPPARHIPSQSRSQGVFRRGFLRCTPSFPPPVSWGVCREGDFGGWAQWKGTTQVSPPRSTGAPSSGKRSVLSFLSSTGGTPFTSPPETYGRTEWSCSHGGERPPLAPLTPTPGEQPIVWDDRSRGSDPSSVYRPDVVPDPRGNCSYPPPAPQNVRGACHVSTVFRRRGKGGLGSCSVRMKRPPSPTCAGPTSRGAPVSGSFAIFPWSDDSDTGFWTVGRKEGTEDQDGGVL